MRGVNKLVMEIRSDGEYFEKVLLFLRPEKQNAPQKDISDGAEKLLYKIKTNNYNRKNNNILFILIGILAGSAVSWGTVFLIGLI